MSSTEHAPGLFIRGFAPPLRLADFKLIAFDMDSTLINIECVDEIAEAVGRKAEVAEITEAAMRGEIADYKDSLRRRMALLTGAPVAALERVWADKLRLNPGVEAFVSACQAAGLKTLLVSGGFTFFSERIRHQLGLDFARANTLGDYLFALDQAGSYQVHAQCEKAEAKAVANLQGGVARVNLGFKNHAPRIQLHGARDAGKAH